MPVRNTGTLETGKQNGHRLELSFQTHIRFFAEVEITDTEGKTESGRSEIYVSGIAPEKTPEKNWIGNGTGDPFYALRFLEPGKKLKNAYCSAAATGQYELRINGKLPDDSVLNGSWTDFHKRIHYRTFEVTTLLKEGTELSFHGRLEMAGTMENARTGGIFTLWIKAMRPLETSWE